MHIVGYRERYKIWHDLPKQAGVYLVIVLDPEVEFFFFFNVGNIGEPLKGHRMALSLSSLVSPSALAL